MSKRELKRLRNKADKVFSLFIRSKTKDMYRICPLCLDNPVQACFHFIRKKAAPWLRWKEYNVIGSCHRCNWIEYRNPDPSRAWYIREYGVEKYLSLVDEANYKNKRILGPKEIESIIERYNA